MNRDLGLRCHGRTQAAYPANAFTLVELLVVIAIISLLAAMLLPVLGEARKSALAVACAGNQKQLLLAASLYADANDERLPVVYAGVGSTYHIAYGGWAVPMDLYNWHIWQPATTAFAYHYLGGPVDSAAEKAHVLRCPAHRGGMYAPGASYPIGPDGKGNLYSTYMYLPWRGMLTQAHLRFGPTVLREVHPYRHDIMQHIAGRWQKRFAVFADAVGVDRSGSWPGSNHGEGRSGCYGGNFAFADGSCKWFPWRWYGANIATAYGSGGWMLSDKCWFADQSQGMIWMPQAVTSMDCDFNAGVGTTYVPLGIGEAQWSARYVQSTGDLLGGPAPW